MRIQKLIFLLCVVAGLNGCSTRQVAEELSGATAQRLVTYSIEKLISDLPDSDFSSLHGKTVNIKSHFIKRNETLKYAHEMLKLELAQRFNIKVLPNTEVAEIELNFFFNALATDADTYGLSLPIVNLADTSQSSQINILAVDMFHGVSEFMYYIKDNQSNEILKKRRMLARVKSDNFSTPILNFPISNLD